VRVDGGGSLTVKGEESNGRGGASNLLSKGPTWLPETGFQVSGERKGRRQRKPRKE